MSQDSNSDSQRLILGRGAEYYANKKNNTLAISPGAKFNYSLDVKMDPECPICKAAGRPDFKSHTSVTCPRRGNSATSGSA